MCPTPNLNPKLGPLPVTTRPFPRTAMPLGRAGATEGPRTAPLIPSAPRGSLLHSSLPLSPSSHSSKWTFPLVPCKASPPTPRPLEISPSAVSTHQGIVSKQAALLRGQRVPALHLARPLRDSDSLLAPALTSISHPIAGTPQPSPNRLPASTPIPFLSPHSKTPPTPSPPGWTPPALL